ncbi:APC family permease [Leptolyngbya ohadii]|uniref:APC family permease n=1 Tax=Leptolyngbya ohadii TaxID=1962290 RepID=UPI000B59EF8C|nr:APC family permease [Leptolyngbya ohadii]
MTLTEHQPEHQRSAKPMGFWAIVSIGIGSMVGAGIFALLGLVGEQIGSATIISFVLSGIVALLAGYSYAKMGAKYPSNGGIVEFLVQGFGDGVLAGTLSLMFYVTLVVASAMVAKTFGHYAAELFFGANKAGIWVNIFACAIVLLLAFVNAVSVSGVGRLETVIVLVKMTILIVFMLVALVRIDPSLLTASNPSIHSGDIVATLGLTFLAYAGFGIITNAGADVPNPSRTVPAAMFSAIGIVMVLYIGIGFAVFGNLSADAVMKYKETVLAYAALPVFGQAGFWVLSIAALLATASALNSNLFGELNTSYVQATLGQLPQRFNRKVWHQATFGFVLSLAAILVLVNFLSLGAIASVTSITFLTCYLAVHCAHYRRADETGGSRLLILLGIVSIVAVGVIFLQSLITTQPVAAVLFFTFLAVCFIVESLVLRTRRNLTA